MSGIDKIIQHISDNSDKICEEIITNAQLKAEAISEQARLKAADIEKAYEEKTAQKLADISARTKSSAALEERKAMLSMKRETISSMLDNALDNALSLPDDEYFQLILKMISSVSQPQKGIIRFGEKDLKRMPAGFMDNVNSVSAEELTLDESPSDTEAGFILVYGGVEVNCSFSSVFSSLYEQLCDRASAVLF